MTKSRDDLYKRAYAATQHLARRRNFNFLADDCGGATFYVVSCGFIWPLLLGLGCSPNAVAMMVKPTAFARSNQSKLPCFNANSFSRIFFKHRRKKTYDMRSRGLSNLQRVFRK
jgi:hypothetical protein